MEENKKSCGTVRRICGDVLIALFVLLTVEVVVVMRHRISTFVLQDDYRTIFRYDLLICAILLLFALDLRFGFFTKLRFKPAKIVGWILRVAVIALAAVLLFFCGRVVVGSLIRTAGDAEHVIVLGMALEDGEPTADLLSRLDTAQSYLERHPGAVLILTGGNPDESGKTEAEVMRERLLARGVPEESMILEDQAESTKDNFRNTAELLDPTEPIVLISSDYHMDRAVKTARNAGFTRVQRLPAPSPFFSYGASMLGEVVLELNELGK